LHINLEDFVTKSNLYVTILGSYEIVIGIDWLESHDVIINCKTRRLSLIDDKGQRRVIVGRNHRVSPWFIFSLQIQKIMHKAFKLYSILMKNDKGEAEGLENPLVV
jgi:hypothetical protein